MTRLPWRNPEKRKNWLVGSFFLIGLIGVIDYLTGYELAFSPFYLFPVILVSWRNGKRLGIVASVLSALMWWAADVLSGHVYSSPIIPFLNTFLRLVSFLVPALLVTRLKGEKDMANQLARSDVVTGIANARSLLEYLDLEVSRATRYHKPITVVYFDLDQFKSVNDRYGHIAGNQALRQTARVLSSSLRKVDFAARMGGDEFAIVLPETGKEAAALVCGRLLACLNEEMARLNLPVTFSMGAVTAEQLSVASAESLLRLADDVMYQVKRNGKNALRCAVYTGNRLSISAPEQTAPNPRDV